MSLGHGRHYLAIPGPSVMPDRVLSAMHRAAPNIYEGELPAGMPGLVRDLKAVARTRHAAAIYIANGHGAWEAAIANVLSPGDEVLVLATGRFAIGWAETAERLGVRCRIIDFGLRDTIDLDRVAEALQGDRGHALKAVLTVQTDTATGIRNDVAALRGALDAAGHPALLMIDCIASLGCDRFEMDAWGVDVMVTGSQKGLMTPPGLGFVFFNDKADAARGRMERVSAYWDWRPRADASLLYEYFAGTAPTHHIFGLRAALDMLVHEEGLEAAWARHATLARAVWAACDRWGQDGPLEVNARAHEIRSHSVTALRIGPPYGTALRTWCEERAGLTLGIGLGMAERTDPAWDGFFRIGHMGHVNAHMVLGALGVIEAGLTALGIPHGRGALDAAAAVCAEA